MTPLRLLLLAAAAAGTARAADRPNVLVVITDDQGFGDLGYHGNPVLQTPHLDAFAGQAVRLKNFHVSPVCSPTRSALLTGLYTYRTGVVDTHIGRSMMRPGIPTLAERLAAAGYRTGIFGKWHLGDNYPLRPEDRGFQQTLWHQGGGLAQPADHPDLDPRTAYFDPILTKNGQEVRTKGYCTDVFADGAVEFMKADRAKPFFAYVAFNAPHGPFQVPAEWEAKYQGRDLTPTAFPKEGQPWAAAKLNPAEIAKAYGMIGHLDAAFGRMMAALADAGVADDTIVVFLTDNGPGGVRFNAGLRNRKGTVYEGGTRVPCYVRWPKRLKAGHVVEPPTAHIDLTPTLVAACGAKADPGFDGRSLLPLLTGEATGWPDRTLFAQWHRGDVPEKFRAFSARGPRYKLVQSAGTQPNPGWKPKFELFDIPNDPFEQTDLAAKLPAEVEKLKGEYERWFADVTKQGFAPPRIVVGSDKQPLVRLTRQDWRGSTGWGPTDNGHWEITAERAGRYKVTVRSRQPFTTAAYDIGMQGGLNTVRPAGTTRAATFEATLPKGDTRIGATVSSDDTKERGPDYIELEYAGEK